MAASSIQANSPREMSDIAVEITDLQSALAIDHAQIDRAVRIVLTDAGVRRATVSVAIVDDAQIIQLNRKYLQHDYATDVLSFTLHDPHSPLEAEVIVSAETALRMAPRYGWDAPQELLMYVIHGTLHLVGYDDASAAEQATMRRREADVLSRLGVTVPGAASSDEAQDGEPTS